MIKNKFKKSLTCIKTGSKAKIINSYDLNDISYVKVNITMEFEGSNFSVIKTLSAEDLKNEFN